MLENSGLAEEKWSNCVGQPNLYQVAKAFPRSCSIAWSCILLFPRWTKVPLDPGAAVPPPPGGRVVRRGRGTAAHPVDAQQRRYQPANSGQERKRLIGLPGAAVGAAQAESAPVERVAAAVAEPVDQETKGNEPADGDDEVGRPVNEGPREGEQPDDRQQDGQGRDDLGVDEAAEGPRGLVVLGVEIMACDASDDGCEDELNEGRGKNKN